MTKAPEKFLPRPNPETAAYWEGCRRHELLIQRCTQCSEYQFYPRVLCSACLSEQVEWVRSSGRGHVLTFTIVRRAVSEAYAPEVPYVVALVQLAEGPRMMSNLVQCEPDSVKVGMPVEVIFEDWSKETTIPKFRPATSTASAG